MPRESEADLLRAKLRESIAHGARLTAERDHAQAEIVVAKQRHRESLLNVRGEMQRLTAERDEARALLRGVLDWLAMTHPLTVPAWRHAVAAALEGRDGEPV